MSGKRDPRANWLDEDPFEKINNNSKTHTRARDDGNWRKPHIRVVTGSAGQPFFRAFNSPPENHRIPVHKGSIWHFSKTEVVFCKSSLLIVNVTSVLELSAETF